MNAVLQFEFPFALWLSAPAVAALALAAWRLRRGGVPWPRVRTLTLLRGLALMVLLALVARPVWFAQEPPAASAQRPVMVLVDRSESMSLGDQGRTQYQQALDFLRARLLPALKSANLPVQALLFDQTAELADGPKLTATAPKGRRTNLAGGIAQAIESAPQPPLAVIALTDGIANESADNSRALTALVDAHVPFIGVGFGNDQGVRTLSLRDAQAPATVPTKTSFSLAAELEMQNSDEMPPFDLVLFRDGQLTQKKSVSPGRGSRTWLENFQLSEDKPGIHNYSVQLSPPDVLGLKCVSAVASTSVRISDEKELRILYIQGALTWDYKFINLALRTDPTIKLTGLTRTSKQSVFRQNVESAGELMNGFPTMLEELSPFRVIVLSNLRPSDLTPAQQEILARFCGELGGGLLLIGGPATFDLSWQGSRLEQLLPVVFSSQREVAGLDRPFRLQLTEEALRQPLFQLADGRPAAEIWSQLPTFSQYGRVDGAKPAAQVWMLHQSDEGPQGRRILMASQHYGAGLSAVLTVQNFWRWRLAKEAEPTQFDRFWRQLFRYLSEAGRQDIAIHLTDQDLHPQMDVRVLLEKQPNPKNLTETNRRFFVRAEDSQHILLQEEAVELQPLKPVEFKFHAEQPGTYTITVSDSARVPLSARNLEIRDLNLEFQNTARSMETLRQWAGVSDGLAFKAEDCPAAADLVAQIKAKVEEVRHGQSIRRIVGVNGWVLALVAGCLAGEWALRKRWGLR